MFLRCWLVLTLSGFAAAQNVTIVTGGGQPAKPVEKRQPSKPEELGSMAGRALNALTGEPLARTRIYFNSSDPAAPVSTYTITTDEGGAYEAKGMEPGSYRLRTSRVGFLSVELPADTAKSLTLTAGQKMTQVDLKAMPEGVITGKVVDHDDEPMPGYLITPVVFKYVGGQRVLVEAKGSPQTNDLGEYRLDSLPAGKYFIVTNRETYSGGNDAELDRSARPRREGYVATYYPGTIDPMSAVAVEVRAGQTVPGVDIKLLRTRITGITGRIVNQTGATFRNSRVALRSAGIAQIWPVAQVTPGPQGEFEIQGFSPGQYVLSVDAYTTNSRIYRAREEVAASSDPLLNLNVPVTKGVDVSGVVEVEGEGKPELKPFRVGLKLPGRVSLGYSAAPVKLDDSGAFQWNEVPLERYVLDLANVPEGFYVKSARLGDTDALEKGIDLRRGGGSLKLVLSGSTASVAGVVKDDSDTGVNEATVALVPRQSGRQGQPFFYPTAKTDASGNFTVKNLIPGDYKVYAWTSVNGDPWLNNDFLRQSGRNSTDVSLQEGKSETINLRVNQGEK